MTTTSEFKGTPGPWLVREFPGGWCQPRQFVTDAREDANGRFVGQVIAAPTTCPDWTANARLIAAAPDLLAACAEFVAVMRRGERPDLLSLINAMHAADAALAKATGTGEALP